MNWQNMEFHKAEVIQKLGSVGLEARKFSITKILHEKKTECMEDNWAQTMRSGWKIAQGTQNTVAT